MPAKFIRATDAIEINQIGCVIYGQPGARKTSLLQTADQPFTFGFDPGLYRCYGRKDCCTFDEWGDVVRVCQDSDLLKQGQSPSSPWPNAFSHKEYCDMLATIIQARTLGIDTLGMGMESLSKSLILENPKNGNKLGGLSLPGFGALATQFGQWIAGRHGRGQDIVMICHEDSEKVGDEDYHFPAVIGKKFYGTMMQYGDVVGYLHHSSGRHVLELSPSDRWMAKTPPSDNPNGVGQLVVPDFAKEPDFLGKILAQAKANMGRVAAQSAAVATSVKGWEEWLAADPTLDAVHEKLTADFPKLQNGARASVWTLVSTHMAGLGYAFDKGSKKFVLHKEGATA